MTPDLKSYNRIIIAFSGGKDSLACLLYLIELKRLGFINAKTPIEPWHHEVDGREGSSLMDWPCTRDYCRKVAQAFGLKIYYSWKVGGFEGEMLRHNARTQPTMFETPDGIVQQGGNAGKIDTRLQFPQVGADLGKRWCSAYLKIDVASMALRNQERFNHSRTLFVTGERGEESPHRARYNVFEPHRADNRDGESGRHIDHWRPVLHELEDVIWAVIRYYGINPHPAYKLGWGRVSCSACIFGSADQWASLKAVNPKQFERIARYEINLAKTINFKSRKDPATKEKIVEKIYVTDLADQGKAYEAITPELVAEAMSEEYQAPVSVPSWRWQLPAGAFGEKTGPT